MMLILQAVIAHTQGCHIKTQKGNQLCMRKSDKLSLLK